MRGAFLIFKKEMLELIKDRKTLFFTLVLPILIYPTIFIMMGKMAQRDAQSREGQPSRIVLVDPGSVLKPALAGQTKKFTLVDEPFAKATQSIRDRKLDLIVEVEADASAKLTGQRTFEVKVHVDPSEDASSLANKRLKEVLKAQDESWVKTRLEALTKAGATLETARPTKIQTVEVGDMGRFAAKMLGSIIPFILVLMMMVGSMQQGIYATAGERERGTLQTLLATSLPRTQIILGKMLYIFAIGVISALANLVSMAFSMTQMVATMGMEGSRAQAQSQALAGQAPNLAGLGALTEPSTLLLSFLLLVPLGLFFANVILLLGLQAKNSQEAGTSITPFLIVVMLMGYMTVAPGAEKMAILPFIPVVNVAVVIRKMIGGQLQAMEYIVAFLWTLGLAGAMTWLSVRILNRDSSIFKTA